MIITRVTKMQVKQSEVDHEDEDDDEGYYKDGDAVRRGMMRMGLMRMGPMRRR